MYFSSGRKYILDKDTIYKYFIRNLLESYRFGKADLIWNRAEYLTGIYAAAFPDINGNLASVIFPLAGLYRAMYVTGVDTSIALDMLYVYTDEYSYHISQYSHGIRAILSGWKHTGDTMSDENIAAACEQINEPELTDIAIIIRNLTH